MLGRVILMAIIWMGWWYVVVHLYFYNIQAFRSGCLRTFLNDPLDGHSQLPEEKYLLEPLDRRKRRTAPPPSGTTPL